MPYYQRRDRVRQLETWEAAVARVAAKQRATTTGQASLDIPAEVLVGEALHHFKPPDLWPVRQWCVHRLKGEGDTAEARDALARTLLEEAGRRAGQQVPWGFLLGWKNRRASRRGEPPRQGSAS